MSGRGILCCPLLAKRLRSVRGLHCKATCRCLVSIRSKDGAPNYSLRVAIGVIITLIMLFGGRIVPSFKRNWLVRQEATRLPAPFSSIDIMSILVSGVALVLWVVVPVFMLSGAALLGALLQFCRLSRWVGLRTWWEPLVFFLHAGYAFVPCGFLLVGLSTLWPDTIPATGALHAWTTGAVGLMTLAVMTRASLGHTGYALSASKSTCTIYVAAIVAAISRIAAAFLPSVAVDLLSLAGVSWLVAYGGFAIAFGLELL